MPYAVARYRVGNNSAGNYFNEYGEEGLKRSDVSYYEQKGAWTWERQSGVYRRPRTRAITYRY
jgi:hypothetical protein